MRILGIDPGTQFLGALQRYHFFVVKSDDLVH